MAPRWKLGRRRRKAAIFLIAFCLAVFAFMLYRYMSFNMWLYSDAKSLQPYSVVLIRNGKTVKPDPAAGTPADAIDQALIASNTRERLVVHLSRSDIRYGPFRRRAYVKVLLETSLPGEPQRVQRIKFLNVLTRKDHTWRVVPEGVVQLTIP